MDASGIVVRDPVLVVGVAPDGLIDGLCLVGSSLWINMSQAHTDSLLLN